MPPYQTVLPGMPLRRVTSTRAPGYVSNTPKGNSPPREAALGTGRSGLREGKAFVTVFAAFPFPTHTFASLL